MKNTFRWSLFAVLVAFADLAMATTYTYSSPVYTTVSGPYTTSMRLTGTLTTALPLPANMPYGNVEPLATDWTFFDGVTTYTKANTSDFSGFEVATDAHGNISEWGVSLITPAGPNTVGETISEVYVSQAGGGAAGGYIGTCEGLNGSNVCDGYSLVSLGIVEGSAGAWATVVPPPPLINAPLDRRALGMLAILLIVLARRFRLRRAEPDDSRC